MKRKATEALPPPQPSRGSRRLAVTRQTELATVHLGNPGSSYVKTTFIELTPRQIERGVAEIIAHFEKNQPVNINYPAGNMRHSINMFMRYDEAYNGTLVIVDSSPQYFREGHGAEIANEIMTQLGCDVERVSTAQLGQPEELLDYLITGTPEQAMRRRLMTECEAAGNMQYLGFCSNFCYQHFAAYGDMYPQKDAEKNPV